MLSIQNNKIDVEGLPLFKKNAFSNHYLEFWK